MRNNILRAILAAVISLSSLFCYAQQDLMVSQQVFSRTNINPAGTGNNKGFDAFLLGRLQWAGVDNSPKTAVLNFTGYSEMVKSSFGLSANYDNIGVGNSQTNVQAVYSYHLDLTPEYILSLGISAGINLGSFDPYANILKDESEMMNSATFVSDKETQVSPDFNAGAEVSNKHWMAGFSCTHLLNDTSTTFRKGRHFYIYGRGFINLTERVDLAPLLSYMHKHKTNTTEIGCQVFYKKMIWGGVAWNPDLNNFGDMSMMSVTLGFELTRFRLGYSYDMNLGKYNNLPSNTHELLLSVHF